MNKKYKTKWFYAPLGTCKVKSGLPTQKAQRQYTQRRVNFDAYATMLADKCNELDREGYDVIQVLPMAMGQSETCQQRSGTYVGDVGFSITRGAVILGCRRDETRPADIETDSVCQDPIEAEDDFSDFEDGEDDGDGGAHG